MGKRLWVGITWPSAIITAIIGTWLLYERSQYLSPWMQAKLGLVTALHYHFACHKIYSDMRRTITEWGQWVEDLGGGNSFPFAIVFLVVCKASTRFTLARG